MEYIVLFLISLSKNTYLIDFLLTGEHSALSSDVSTAKPCKNMLQKLSTHVN